MPSLRLLAPVALALSACTQANLPSDARRALQKMESYGCGFEKLSGPEEVWTRMCLTLGDGGEASSARLELHTSDERLADTSLYVITLYHLGERVWKDVPAPKGDVQAGQVRKFVGQIGWKLDKKLATGAYVVEITRAGDDSRTSNFTVMVR
jgi:hypothetical protein